MSTAKMLFGVLKGATKLGGKALVTTAKATGHVLHGAAKVVENHKEEIGVAAKLVVKGSGSVVRYTGQAVSSGAKAAAVGLHDAAKQSDSKLAKVAGHGLGLAADAIGLAGTATSKTGSLVERAAPFSGAAAGGLVSGTIRTTSRVVDSVTVTQTDIEKLTSKLKRQSILLKQQSQRRLAAIDAAQRGRRKKELLDLLVVGGVTLATCLNNPERIPPEVEEAFSRAYPGLTAQGETFAEAVERTDPENLVGLVNGVKGKLFEIELVEHLNNGNLPDGMHAELADSVTQKGFDVRILDEQGQVVEVLQAKATESADYVKEALERYPDIDVVTTTEVHSQLVAIGTAEQVSNSGISEAALQEKVESAAASGSTGGFDSSDLLPSALGMAIIALSVFTTKGATAEMLGDEFGKRTANAGLSSMVGNVAMVATGTWWLGLAAGVGTTWLAAKGGTKRERYEELKRVTADVSRAVQADKALLSKAGIRLLT